MTPPLTVRVATLFRVPVRIHLLLPAAAALFVVTTPRYTDPLVLLALLQFLVVMLASVLAHELGHALVARRHRLEARSITLWPLGGVTEVDEPRTGRAKVRTALAGVGVNLVLALACGAGILLLTGELPRFEGLKPDNDVLRTAWNLNLALALLNLLPGLPFDGGTAVEGLLLRRFGARRSRYGVLVSGALLGMGLFLLGLQWGSVMLAALAGWALFEVLRGFRRLGQEGEEPEMLLGVYDFSNGHTSLEDSAPVPPVPPRRFGKDAARLALEAERRAAADITARESSRARLDDLLDRIASDGIGSLSEDERAFLNEESRRLRALRPGKSPSGR